MYNEERFQSLLRSGDISEVCDGIYWAVPDHLKKRKVGCKQSMGIKKIDRPTLIKQIKELRGRLYGIQKEMDVYNGKKDELPTQEDYDAHIKRLHKFNEIKDVGEMLIGKLAEMRHVKVEELYDEYSLPRDQ